MFLGLAPSQLSTLVWSTICALAYADSPQGNEKDAVSHVDPAIPAAELSPRSTLLSKSQGTSHNFKTQLKTPT